MFPSTTFSQVLYFTLTINMIINSVDSLALSCSYSENMFA